MIFLTILNIHSYLINSIKIELFKHKKLKNQYFFDMYVAKPLLFPINVFLAYITANYPLLLTDYVPKKFDAVLPRHTLLNILLVLLFKLLKHELFELLKLNI